ncbi:putative tellurium resistance membrane protein TerC [Agromyces cerinus]|uniref:hypothetical protein n=1 Tax=Agromyces cerinus TaxID=33878 RepID=UPI00195B0EB1|nr:hypothetical protein [Agromyces cerinus]MBM7831898.1 putative tellurium resistance membrane protein TerC [Agromyces cerinus]
MRERTTAILAGIGVSVVAIGSGIWLARLGAWGLVAFTVVLAGGVVGLLVHHERHRPADPVDEDDGDRHHGYEWSP